MPTNQLLPIDLAVPLVALSPLSRCEVCIILPARDESARIEKCLLALARQIDLRGFPIPSDRYEVIVLANNCGDRTASLARAFGRRHPGFVLHVVEMKLSPERSFVGCARKLLMDEACRRLLALGRTKGVIASTDADSFVESTWVAAILKEVQAGADAVGGRITADREERLRLSPSAERTYLRKVAYDFLLAELEHLIDPDPFDLFPRHANHIGASIAVTAATYAAIGGLPNVLEEEDAALYKAIVRSGARFRHSLDVRVTTSARLDGRVKHGFATGLMLFGNSHQNSPCLWVENVSGSENRLRARGLMRKIWHGVRSGRALPGPDLKAIARLLRISASWLANEFHEVSTWGQLVEQVELQQIAEGEWERFWPKTFLERAIERLRIRVAELRRSAS